MENVSPTNESLEQDDVPGSLKGALLLDAIAHEAVIQGVRIESLGERFGFADNYWMSIVNGHNSLAASAKARLEKIADFLHRPFVEVLSLAEYLEPQHFLVRSTLEDELNLVYTSICGDRRWATYAMTPEKWDALDIDAKILISFLYQDATRQNLLKQFKVYQVEHHDSETNDPQVVRPSRVIEQAKTQKPEPAVQS